jgi:hypothetical protein
MIPMSQESFLGNTHFSRFASKVLGSIVNPYLDLV